MNDQEAVQESEAVKSITELIPGSGKESTQGDSGKEQITITVTWHSTATTVIEE